MTEKNKQWLVITLAAAAMLMVMMGARQSLGLFVSPLNISTGLGIVTISLAMAVNQFVWGAVQPLAGALADRFGAGRVLAAGVLMFVLSNALTPSITTGFGLFMTLGLLSAIGSRGSAALRSRSTAITHGCGIRMHCWLLPPRCSICPSASRTLNPSQCRRRRGW